MKFLLSNDDGVNAEGLQTLRRSLASLGAVIVFAPDRDRSGASNSLTLDRPLRIWQVAENTFAVNGTPTDCVHLALTGLLDEKPDMVVSGINHAANLGDDVLYSGTVAAAIEGRFLGLPAVAVSLAYKHNQPVSGALHFETAALAVVRIIQRLQTAPLPQDTILNVNVPNVPVAELQGFEVTRLGYRHMAENVVKDTDPRGHPIYWIGPAGPEADAGPGTDFHAVKNKRVSITPLQTDMTRYAMMDSLKDWVAAL
jgi:5'-nucleotidase